MANNVSRPEAREGFDDALHIYQFRSKQLGPARENLRKALAERERFMDEYRKLSPLGRFTTWLSDKLTVELIVPRSAQERVERARNFPLTALASEQARARLDMMRFATNLPGSHKYSRVIYVEGLEKPWIVEMGVQFLNNSDIETLTTRGDFSELRFQAYANTKEGIIIPPSDNHSPILRLTAGRLLVVEFHPRGDTPEERAWNIPASRRALVFNINDFAKKEPLTL